MTDSPPVDESDFDALLELLSADTMREVVGMFTTSAPSRLATAAAGIESGDQAAAATAFHTLRSGCGQLGARRLEELCAAAEGFAKKGNLADTRVHLALIREEFARCHAWFVARGWLLA